MLVREQHTPLQAIGTAFRERLMNAQKASFLFVKIRWCSLFFVGFAVMIGF
jgi:hypothetical protein